MADARYRLRATDPDFGTNCPRCAAPKAKQARRCRACYRDDQLGARCGPENPNWKGGYRKQRRGAGRPTGRPQPQSHPWRKKNALLFRKRAA